MIASRRSGLVAAVALAASACGGREQDTTPAATVPAAGSTAAAPTSAAAAQPWLTDVTAGSGVTFVHRTGASGAFCFPEIAVGGACLIDADGDGLLDVYLVQSGCLTPGCTADARDALWRNRGDWTFEDVTAAAGIDDDLYGSGCAVGDVDGDGDDDLYVTNVGPDILYRNDGGRFTDVSREAGIANPEWSASAAFGDLDADGDLDLFVANYVAWSKRSELQCGSAGASRDYCSPKNYKAPLRDTLYRNRGDGTFEDVSAAAGLGAAFGNGLGVVTGDFDEDGDADVFVANDGTPNQLWLNDGAGRFRDGAVLAGCALNRAGWADAGMGVQAFDAEHDGDLDLFVTHLEEETNSLFVNDGRGFFEDKAAPAGLAAPSLGFTGWGVGFHDFDHDGLLDAFVANGRVRLSVRRTWDEADRYAEPSQLFRGTAEGKFAEVQPISGLAAPVVRSARAAAFGDLDGDGDVDVVLANRDAGPTFLRNDAGSRGRWARFRVVDAQGRVAVGARVRAAFGGRVAWRVADPSYSYAAANDPRVHFGLGTAQTVEAVVVRWPDGHEETFGPFPAGSEHELRRRG